MLGTGLPGLGTEHLPGALCSGTGSPALGLCLGFPSRRGLTPRGSLECKPEIPAFPGEEYYQIEEMPRSGDGGMGARGAMFPWPVQYTTFPVPPHVEAPGSRIFTLHMAASHDGHPGRQASGSVLRPFLIDLKAKGRGPEDSALPAPWFCTSGLWNQER